MPWIRKYRGDRSQQVVEKPIRELRLRRVIRRVRQEVVTEDSSDEPFNAWDLAPGESCWSSLPSDFF